MVSTFEEFIDLVRQYGLPDDVASLARPAIAVRVGRVDGEIGPGDSRFGGSPDLPRNIPWPTNAGRPLTHLAQIRLSDIAPYTMHSDLPTTGWLVFFVLCADPHEDASDEPTSRVLYIADGTQFERAIHPDHDELHACDPEFAACLTLPHIGSDAVAPLVSSGETPDRHGENWDLYQDLTLELGQFVSFPKPPKRSLWQRLTTQSPRYGYHGMLGYPDSVWLTPDQERNHVLLLQSFSDPDGLGVDWDVRGASLCFLLPRDDLRSRNFDAAKMLLVYED